MTNEYIPITIGAIELLALITRKRELEGERDLLKALLSLMLDKPEDRLWHAEDNSWWRREGNVLKSADEPGPIKSIRYRVLEEARDAQCEGCRKQWPIEPDLPGLQTGHTRPSGGLQNCRSRLIRRLLDAENGVRNG